MGVPLSTTIFVDLDLNLESKLLIPIIIFQGLQLAFASILIGIFRRWVDARKDQDAESGENTGGEERIQQHRVQ